MKNKQTKGKEDLAAIAKEKADRENDPHVVVYGIGGKWTKKVMRRSTWEARKNGRKV